MLYVNVYLVTQLYGGPEEGNWYFDAGSPLASIPIVTKRENQDYYCISETIGYGSNKKIDKVEIHLRECFDCEGDGEYEEEDEYDHERRTVRCTECGEVPADLEGTAKLMKDMYDLFHDDVGRYEHIQVMLQKNFATPFPEHKPHYE